jgi:predicted AlkP superfamily pyrophosphatase or phosphodiesterase
MLYRCLFVFCILSTFSPSFWGQRTPTPLTQPTVNQSQLGKQEGKAVKEKPPLKEGKETPKPKPKKRAPKLIESQNEAPPAAPGIDLSARPKFVIGITIDQMRMDYLYRYWNSFGDEGFKRIVQNGMVCADHHFGYAPTYTGPGHASIFTGTTPRFHGIIGNDWFDRHAGESVYCTFDSTHQVVGSKRTGLRDGQMSPHRMHASTIGDELKFATDMKAKVIGISLKDRGAILPAGHTADAAYWFYGKDEGKFITSTYYMDELPKWASKWNKKGLANRYMKANWIPALPPEAYGDAWPDNNPYEGSFTGGERPSFPYNLKALQEANGGFDILKATPHGNTMLVDFAVAVIENEGLGSDAVTDLLALSFSSTDYVGHQFGAHAWETMDTYVRLDMQLARLFKNIDKFVGEGEWLCWLTADHGGATVPSLAASEGLPVEYWKPGNMIESVEQSLQEKYGEGEWMLRYSNDQFFLNRPLIRSQGIALEEAQQFVRSICLETPGVLTASTSLELGGASAGVDDIMERLRMGLHSAKSGDVMVVPEPGWLNYGLTGTSHGSPFPYDTHVPCIFYGWNIQPGITYDRTHIRDIAPTISALIHSPLPNACSGRPIQAVLEHD